MEIALFVLGYYIQLLASGLLVDRIIRVRSIYGLSRDTQWGFLLATLSRCAWSLDTRIVQSRLGALLCGLELLGSLLAAAFLCFQMHTLRHTTTKQAPVGLSVRLGAPLIALFSFVVHPGASWWSLQALVSFTMYMEAYALLPQLWLLRKMDDIEPVTSHYVGLLVVARAIRMVFWAVLYAQGERFASLFLADVLHTMLSADYFSLWVNKLRNGGQLMADSLDVRAVDLEVGEPPVTPKAKPLVREMTIVSPPAQPRPLEGRPAAQRPGRRTVVSPQQPPTSPLSSQRPRPAPLSPGRDAGGSSNPSTPTRGRRASNGALAEGLDLPRNPRPRRASVGGGETREELPRPGRQIIEGKPRKMRVSMAPSRPHSPSGMVAVTIGNRDPVLRGTDSFILPSAATMRRANNYSDIDRFGRTLYMLAFLDLILILLWVITGVPLAAVVAPLTLSGMWGARQLDTRFLLVYKVYLVLEIAFRIVIIYLIAYEQAPLGFIINAVGLALNLCTLAISVYVRSLIRSLAADELLILQITRAATHKASPDCGILWV